MPNFAANLSMMYTEYPFLDRFEAAAKDGFKAVEYLFPYDFSPEELAARLKASGLQQVLFNAPPGGTDKASIAEAWNSGAEKGTAAMPGREAEFQTGFLLAMQYADALGCPRVHVMAGRPGAAVPRELAQSTYVKNLKWAAEQAAKHGVKVLIEPINTRDMPNYFINRQDHAHEVVALVASPHLQVQMDLYHLQIVEGDVAKKLRHYLPTGAVGHIQIAGVPDRHEPDSGELNIGYLMGVLDEVSAECVWQGWVGCEYRPRLGGQPGGTSAGLGWLRQIEGR